MKIRAASTVEALMAMILSGIILSAVSAGFIFVVRSYDMYSKINDTTNEQLLFTGSMNTDVVNCDYITRKENQILFHSTKKGISSYEFIPNLILKRTESRTDTFHVSFTQYHCYLNNKEQNEENELTDAIKIITDENKTMFFSKVYAADVLIENELKITNGNGI
jgi:hypothetical protein